MKFDHAMGFLSIGLVMLVLPQLAPGLCPRTGFDGTSARELWLQGMGTLQVALGGVVGLWNTGCAIARRETLPVAKVPEKAMAETERVFSAGDSSRVAHFDFAQPAEWAGRDAA